jgi:monoamine oxidase
MKAPAVIVLGAGAAGLAAARVLLRAGVRIEVLEARDRTGGRVDTRRDPLLGVALERGAEFVHGRPPPVVALAREAGEKLRPVPDRRLLLQGGRLRPPPAAEDLLARARDDRESVEDLLSRARRQRWAAPAALASTRASVEGFYLADPRSASASALARMNRALETIGAGRSYRADAGWASLLAPLADEVRRAGVLRLGVRATAVRWRPGAVEVAGRGLAGGPLPAVRGERLLLTLPVGTLQSGDVRFHPVPTSAARAWARLAAGPVVKVLLRFRRQPWGDAGTTARAGAPTFLLLPGAPVPVFWTLAPRRAPVLVGWAGGPRARALAGLAAPELLRRALRGLAPALRQHPSALEDQLEAAEVVDWMQDPLARGGYAVFPVGSAGASEGLARPVDGTLFFAGEATEPDFAGTVDGALRSGERAARQVLQSLEP